jgi:fused signal recognition particle receptor
MDNQSLLFIIMAAAVILGTIFTVIYYFARYYIKFDESDKEVVPQLKTKGPTNLKEAMKKTREGFWGRISTAVTEDEIDALEEALFTSDLGPQTAQRLFSKLGAHLSSGEVTSDSLRTALKAELLGIFEGRSEPEDLFEQAKNAGKPVVWMVVGVNGVGKTTTIGKLASLAQKQGLKTLIVAGDTFRAAADEQLKVWSERSGCEIHMQPDTKDPAAVAYSGLEKAKANQFDLVIVDTAGRLHTQDHLMEELKKVKRVMPKIVEGAPHQTLLVLDANSGQNALIQAKNFNDTLELSGVALTKLDGTSKGGVAFGLVWELGLPIRYIGVGESVEDLRPFEPQSFVDSII